MISGYWAEARWTFPCSKAIQLAIEYGRHDIARFSVGKAPRVDTTCGEGWRPLHHAAFADSPAVTEVLLQVGTDPHAVTAMAKARLSLGYLPLPRPGRSWITVALIG